MFRALKAIALATILIGGGCSMRGSQPGTDHIAFTLRDNLLVIPATVGGAQGEFILGTAQAHTTLDPQFQAAAALTGRIPVVLGSRLNRTTSVERAEMSAVADGILGTGVFADRTLGIDFRRGLIAVSKERVPSEGAEKARFENVPTFPVAIDGTRFTGVIDTTNPDTILLPESVFGSIGRRQVSVRMGSHPMGTIDARVAPVSEIRIGNRLLANFFISIDYARGEISLWPWESNSPPASSKSL